MKKIRTIKKVKQHTDGLLYYVARQILKFTQNDKQDNFSVVYQEYIFDIDEINDENSDIITSLENIITKYPEFSETLSTEKVNAFFSLSKKGVFNVSDFNRVQVEAMLYDTINQEKNGRYNTKEWIKYVTP